MKIAVVGPLLLFVIALSIEGLPVDNRRALYQDWNDAIELARNRSGTPGLSVAVLLRGKVIYAEGFGKRNDRGDPVTAETLMPIGSMTKAMTASMIGELVAEGKLDWDKTPVSEYVPEAQFGPALTSELTLADYLSHRSGLPHEDFAWFNTTETRSQVFRRLKHLNLPDKLLSDTQYSNMGYTIAGEAAANIAKVPYERLVRDKIFRPLGLTHTGFSPIEMGKRDRNHARPYYAESLKDAQSGRFHQGELNNEIEFVSAAGDAYSNSLDLLKWGSTIMHYGRLNGKQVLNKTSVEAVLTAHTIYRAKKSIPELSPTTTYGMGWFIDAYQGQTMYYHGGNTLGFSSMICLFPDSDLVITVLSNMYVAILPDTIPFFIADEILNLPRTKDWLGKETLDVTERVFQNRADEEAGVRFPPRLNNRQAAHHLSDYTGSYTNSLFTGDVKITLLETGELHFLFNTFSSKVEHYHYETFSFFFDTWSAKTKQLVTFITGQDGEVEALELEYLEENWTFKKQINKAIVTMTSQHRCHDQEEVDIHMENEREEEKEQDQFQFKFGDGLEILQRGLNHGLVHLEDVNSQCSWYPRIPLDSHFHTPDPVAVAAIPSTSAPRTRSPDGYYHYADGDDGDSLLSLVTVLQHNLDLKTVKLTSGSARSGIFRLLVGLPLGLEKLTIQLKYHELEELTPEEDNAFLSLVNPATLKRPLELKYFSISMKLRGNDIHHRLVQLLERSPCLQYLRLDVTLATTLSALSPILQSHCPDLDKLFFQFYGWNTETKKYEQYDPHTYRTKGRTFHIRNSNAIDRTTFYVT
ncbi:hypothetical protein BGZ83_003739 [Gryganskiella cystojenkinii]|nr:hypothetical protein BGZ83_003739 [Gryganskiella cystojenkinii]